VRRQCCPVVGRLERASQHGRAPLARRGLVAVRKDEARVGGGLLPVERERDARNLDPLRPDRHRLSIAVRRQ